MMKTFSPVLFTFEMALHISCKRKTYWSMERTHSHRQRDRDGATANRENEKWKPLCGYILLSGFPMMTYLFCSLSISLSLYLPLFGFQFLCCLLSFASFQLFFLSKHSEWQWARPSATTHRLVALPPLLRWMVVHLSRIHADNKHTCAISSLKSSFDFDRIFSTIFFTHQLVYIPLCPLYSVEKTDAKLWRNSDSKATAGFGLFHLVM